MLTAYIYPDGHVTSQPDAGRSDDFFTVTDLEIEGAIEEVTSRIQQHFGTTGQAFSVLADVITYNWVE